MYIKWIEKIILCLNYLIKGKGVLDNFFIVMLIWYLVKFWYNICLKFCLIMIRRMIVIWLFIKYFIGFFDIFYSLFWLYGFFWIFSFVM